MHDQLTMRDLRSDPTLFYRETPCECGSTTLELRDITCGCCPIIGLTCTECGWVYLLKRKIAPIDAYGNLGVIASLPIERYENGNIDIFCQKTSKEEKWW